MSTIKVANVQHTSNSNDSISIANDSSVALKHSGNAKLTTTATGIDVSGVCNATSFTGDASNLQTSASNLSSGIIPDARFPSTLPAVSGANLTGISAGALELVADYSVPAGTTVSSFTIFPNPNGGAGGATSGFPANNKYLLRGHISYTSNGGHLIMHPYIYDTSGPTQYGHGGPLGSAHSYTTATHHYGGQTGNQSSSEWYVYEGGYYYESATFELWFTTYYRPHAQSRLFGETNADAICHGNHFDTGNRNTRRINGVTFTNSWGYSFDDKTKLSLYKYSNY